MIAHHVAVRMGVKVFDGQAFHMLRQVAAQVAHRALRDVNHDPRLRVVCQRAHQIEYRDAQYRKQKRRKIGSGLRFHRDNVIIDQVLDEQRSLNARQNTDNNAHKD